MNRSEAKRTKLRLSFFGHIMRQQSSLEKITVLEKLEGRKRGCPKLRWSNSLKEATGLSVLELSG